MAKKSFIPADALEATNINIHKAEHAKELQESQPKKVEKDGDVGPIINVNLPLEVKAQLTDMKTAYSLQHKKFTVNSLIRQAVYEYLEHHYTEVTGREVNKD